jgi:hypothetical protein
MEIPKPAGWVPNKNAEGDSAILPGVWACGLIFKHRALGLSDESQAEVSTQGTR